jgi:hypothetical protein
MQASLLRLPFLLAAGHTTATFESESGINDLSEMFRMRRRKYRYMLDSMAKNALERIPASSGLYASWETAGVVGPIYAARPLACDSGLTGCACPGDFTGLVQPASSQMRAISRLEGPLAGSGGRLLPLCRHHETVHHTSTCT